MIAILIHGIDWSDTIKETINELMESQIECWECEGTGRIIVCCDDLCIGGGRCIHEDGEIVCYNCHGEGYVYINDEDEKG